MATDAVVFAILNTDYTNKDLYSGELHVLLIKRDAVQSSGKERPDRGYWALPGGFVAAGVSLYLSLIEGNYNIHYKFDKE